MVLVCTQVRNVGKPHAVVMGIFAPVLLYVCFVLEPKDFGALDVLVMLGMSVTGGYITYFTFPAGGATPRNSMFLTGMAFLMGIAWMDIAADELVAVLEVRSHTLHALCLVSWHRPRRSQRLSNALSAHSQTYVASLQNHFYLQIFEANTVQRQRVCWLQTVFRMLMCCV